MGSNPIPSAIYTAASVGHSWYQPIRFVTYAEKHDPSGDNAQAQWNVLGHTRGNSYRIAGKRGQPEAFRRCKSAIAAGMRVYARLDWGGSLIQVGGPYYKCRQHLRNKRITRKIENVTWLNLGSKDSG